MPAVTTMRPMQPRYLVESVKLLFSESSVVQLSFSLRASLRRCRSCISQEHPIPGC